MTEPKRTTANPGSTEAVAAGCHCPVMDNAHGAGIPSENGQQFFYTAGCGYHADDIRIMMRRRSKAATS